MGGKKLKVPVAARKSAMGSVPRAPFATRGFYGLWQRRRNRPELKTIDTTDTTYASLDSTNGNITFLNGVATGTDFNTRVGRKILMKSILIRYQWYPLTSTSDSNGDVARILVVYDSQPNGSATNPVITDFLQTASYLSPNNLNNRTRFKVLYDKTLTMEAWTMSAGALVNGGPRPRAGTIYKKLSHEAIYNGTGSTVGTIQEGAIFFVVIPATNATTGLIFNSRIRFTDN